MVKQIENISTQNKERIRNKNVDFCSLFCYNISGVDTMKLKFKYTKDLERLISVIDGAVKGENIMRAFDNSEFEKHKAEAKEKWGQTKEYSQYVSKTEKYSLE